MPAPTGALVLRDSVFTVDGTDYANQVRKVRLVPDQSTQTYRTLVPDGAVQDTDSPVWALELEGLQINISGGLAFYLRSVSGSNIACVFQPKSGVGNPKATFTAVAKTVEFGGEQGALLPYTLELPIVGAPVWGTS
jgi:hypothetical protein